MSEATKQITIRRDRGFFALFRKLAVDVDGALVLRIKAGEQHEISVPQAASQLRLRMGWQSSEPIDLAKVDDGKMLVIYIIPRSFQEMRSSKTIPFGIRIEQR